MSEDLYEEGLSSWAWLGRTALRVVLALVLFFILSCAAIVFGPNFEDGEREWRDRQHERWEQERLEQERLEQELGTSVVETQD